MLSAIQYTYEKLGEHYGCGDCTMLAYWRTSKSQKPNECKLNRSYQHCPITGEKTGWYEEFYPKIRFMMILEESDKQ